jgi:hypothetical protein
MPMIYLQQTDGARIPLAVDADGHLVLSSSGPVSLIGGVDSRILTFNGTTWENTPMDPVTRTLQTVDYAHHEIHSGSHFFYADAAELGSAATQDYLITTPNTTRWAHMLFFLDGSAITQWQLFEGADKDGTTPQTVVNSNRNSLTAATTLIHKGTAGGTTDGTQILIYKGGSATGTSRQSGTNTRNDGETILKQNTKYILRVTSGTASNLTNVRLEWYEHVNK